MTAVAEMTSDKTVSTVDVSTGRDVAMPLDRLFISSDNMTTKRDDDYIRSLAATIEAQGLMHRLSITIEADGRGAVHAGGNRLLALQLLQREGKLAVDEPIECKAYENAERAVALSLTENLLRQVMHPADKFVTFAKLAKKGNTVAQIATQMGTSPLTVERFLALGRLAPRFITMLREDKVTLDQLKVLCLLNGHKQQIAVWDSFGQREPTPHLLQKKIVDAEIESTDELALFVGVDAYKAAGGTVREDLFGDEGQCWLKNSTLLNELAEKKWAEVIAEEKAAGWSWVEVKPSLHYYDLQAYERDQVATRRPTKAEAEGIASASELLAAAEKHHFELQSACHEAPSGSNEEELLEAQVAEAEQHVDNLQQHLAELRAELSQWKPEQLAIGGVAVALNSKGQVSYVRGLIKPQDKRAKKKEQIAALKKAGKAIPAALQSPMKGERATFSERLMLDLTAHRTAAMQAALKDNQHVALALVVHAMAVPVFSSRSELRSPLKLRVDLTADTKLTDSASEYKDSPAALALDAAMAQWGERVPGGTMLVMYQWLLAQDTAVLLDLLAFCAASSLDAMHGRERTGYDMSDALVDSLDLNMADWWAPTPAKYLTSVSKDQLIAAVTEAETAEVARPMEKMPKGDAVAFSAAKLDGKRWLPAPLKRKPAPVADQTVAAEGFDGE